MNQELSKREEEVLECLCRGLSNKQIGKELGLRESTIKTHLARIAIKFQTKNRTQTAVQAVKRGYGKDLSVVSLKSLRPQRRKLAGYVTEGLENEEIATKMRIGVASVKDEIASISRDLGLPFNSRSLIAAVYTKSRLPKKP